LANQVYIWWLSQQDYALLTEEMRKQLPKYIADEVRSREGRCGRGRLWVAKKFGEVEAKWSDDNPVCRMLGQLKSGGIVFDPQHTYFLPENIGVVTNTDCRLVPLGA
jgi:hypothetical protein